MENNRQQAERDARLLKTLQSIQPEETRDYNDLEFSQIYSKLFADELTYNVTAKKWFMYDGVRWREDTGGVYAAERAKEMFRVMKVYAVSAFKKDTEKGDAFLKNVLKYGSYNKRETLINDAKSLMSKAQNDFDCKHHLFNCLNCTIDLTTGKAHNHTAADMLTMVSGCEYNPAADGKKWKQFIYEIMQGDTEKIRYLQHICGYFLTTNISLEAAFFLYGATTRNGKSTFVESFRNMMGDYAASIPPDTLAIAKNRNGDAATPQLAKLAGVRFLSISEPPKQMLLDVALFKQLTGGETLSARKLYSEPFDFLPQFKICINCNSLPVVTDDTIFQSERARIITFDRHFEPQEQNKNLKQELKESEVLSSILNWAIEGLKAFRKNGEQPPKSVIDATEIYKAQSDKIHRFFDDCMVKSDRNASGGVVYEVYREWCKENGYMPEGKGIFFSTLKDKGFMRESGTINGRTERNVIVGYERLA